MPGSQLQTLSTFKVLYAHLELHLEYVKKWPYLVIFFSGEYQSCFKTTQLKLNLFLEIVDALELFPYLGIFCYSTWLQHIPTWLNVFVCKTSDSDTSWIRFHFVNSNILFHILFKLDILFTLIYFIM